jgi:hypothetical protein
MFDGGSHSWLISACVVVAVWSATTAITAQTTEEYRTTVQELEEARDSARQVFYQLIDSFPARQVDTVRVGTLTVLAEQPHVDLVRDATIEAWERLSSELRSDTGLLRQKVIFFPKRGEGRLPVVEDAVVGFSLGEDTPTGQIVAAIIGAADRILVRELSERIAEWLPSTLLYELTGARRGPSVAPHFEWTYVRLATSPYSADRGCFAGSMEACKHALWINEVDNPVTELYDARERRRLVEGLDRSRANVFEMAVLSHGCTAQGRDSDCIEYLEAIPRDMLPLPYTPGVRRSLIQAAIEAGGDGSYGRLVGANKATVAGMLESVSGLTVDTLVAEWYAATLEARPTPTAITPALVLSCAIWVFLFVLTATRSSRWRV